MGLSNNSPANAGKPLFAYSYPKEEPQKRRWKFPRWDMPRTTLGLIAGLIVAFFLVLGTHISSRSANLELQAQIAANEEQTSGLTRQLQDLEKQNEELRQRLDSSHTRLGAELSRTRGLYVAVRRDQEKGQEELKHALETKADASQVNSQVSSLKSEQESVKSNVSGLNTEVAAVKQDVGAVRDLTAKHASEIQQHAHEIASNREAISNTSKDLTTFKSSFDREVLSFELPKNGKPVQVADVMLRLDKTSQKNSEFSLEIFLGGKRLVKKNRGLNEPIYFYGEGYRKPFELLITRVDKNVVTGTLSVPKKG